MTTLRVRQLQPPPESDHFTFEEAVEAWKKVEAAKRAREAGRRRSGLAPTARRGPDAVTDEEHP